MKRALSLLLAAVLTVSVLGGCGGAAAPAPEGAAPAETSAPESAASAEASAPESAAPAETSAPEDYSATGQWLLDTLAKYSTK